MSWGDWGGGGNFGYKVKEEKHNTSKYEFEVLVYCCVSGDDIKKQQFWLRLSFSWADGRPRNSVGAKNARWPTTPTKHFRISSMKRLRMRRGRHLTDWQALFVFSKDIKLVASSNYFLKEIHFRGTFLTRPFKNYDPVYYNQICCWSLKKDLLSYLFTLLLTYSQIFNFKVHQGRGGGGGEKWVGILTVWRILKHKLLQNVIKKWPKNTQSQYKRYMNSTSPQGPKVRQNNSRDQKVSSHLILGIVEMVTIIQ